MNKGPQYNSADAKVYTQCKRIKDTAVCSGDMAALLTIAAQLSYIADYLHDINKNLEELGIDISNLRKR